MKPKVYLETTIISYLTARPSRDLIIAAHQELTNEWWENRRRRFDLFVSQLVIQKVKAYKSKGLTISIITLAELYEGIYFSRDAVKSEQMLDSFLLDVSVTNLNEDITKVFARERGKLRQAGNLIRFSATR